MMPFIRYIVSCLLIAFAVNGAMAQDSLLVESSKDSLKISTQEKFFYVTIGSDYGKLATTAFKVDTKYEFNLGFIFFNKLRLSGDYGHGALSPKNAIENGSYTSTGNYYRAGLDYVFNIAPKTYLGIGGMYASSTFNDEGIVQIQSEIWPLLKENFARKGFTAQWVEWVLTSETTILNRDNGFFNNLYFGIKFRLRFMIDKPSPDQFDIYAIPGYGRTFNNIVPAANLFFSYKLKL